MKNTENGQGIFDLTWSFFASVRLTVVTLLLLALTSVIGTLIPQNQSLAFYSSKFGDTLLRLFSFLDIFDMYHSMWFQFLILVLAINILVCSLDRLGPIWKIVRKRPVFKASRFRTSKISESFSGSVPPSSVKEPLLNTFSKTFGSPVQEETEEGFLFFAEKGRWSRLGVYVVHLSILILLAGGLAGSIAGFEGTVKIVEGDSTDIVTLKKGNGEIKLDFTIRCDRFEVSHYDTGAPKEYRSDLTLIENGEEVKKKSIIVNDPLRYKGINIFQSFYGSVPGNEATLHFTGAESGMIYHRTVKTGMEIDLPENFGRFALMGFIPSYNFRGHNLGDTLVGVITKPDGEKRNVILPIKHKQFDKMFKPDVVVEISEFETKPYTGLQVTRDPGVWLVYSGFILMILGCVITFYMSHRSVCLEVRSNDSGGFSAVLYGTANKNRLGMKNLIAKTAGALKASLDKTILTSQQ